MTLLKTLEEKLLFKITRYIFLIFIALLSVAFLGVVISSLSGGSESQVTYKEVTKSLEASKNGTNGQLQSNSLKVSTPENVEKYLGEGKNRDILMGWITSLDGDQQEDFLQNLSTIISQAENDDPNKVTDAINQFKTLKLAKMKTGAIEKYEDRIQIVIRGVLILSILGLIGLFTLVLVLLAVERNTRRAEGS